jgi:hypothetical protein
MASGEIKVEPFNDVAEVERGSQKCQWKRKKEESVERERER